MSFPSLYTSRSSSLKSTRLGSPRASPVSPTIDMSSSAGRKRARLDEDSQMKQIHQLEFPSYPDTQAQIQSTEPVRDDTYYMSDGNIVLQVENTLFNVHRSILSKDGSMFATLFELPQASGDVVDGSSDSNPLMLHGDTVEEFRNFLWALYSLPHELKVLNSPTADLNCLMDIARISFKYQLRSVESWALDVINECINRKDSALCMALGSNPSSLINVGAARASYSPFGPQVSRLVRLAQLCGHTRLLETMVSLLCRLMSASLLYAHLAMTLSDELGLRALRGIAYFEVMQRPVVVRNGELRYHSPDGGDREAIVAPEEDILDAKGRLVVSRAQQLRILTGYYRLSMEWEVTRAHPVAFDHAATCGATWHQHGCTQSWSDFWKEKTKGESVMGLGLGDYLGRLKAIVKEFDKWGSATYLHHDCRMIARRALLHKIKEVEEKLPDFFLE
ncbi:hypothetical protein BXZ70DRAFT_604629 [Cristinia sonorae]|uniref:BTB domain-containing protein n=1 Tax=Cristinia sonorae TaxID=1940300 RepID=A0A8K0XT47_9AGAR|nr:hypothetical protein BXZ70DRAFT_604629 [Cristinia sonorae]